MSIENVLGIEFKYPILGREIKHVLEMIASEEPLLENLSYSEHQSSIGIWDYIGIVDNSGKGIALSPVSDGSETQIQEDLFYENIWLMIKNHPNYMPLLDSIKDSELINKMGFIKNKLTTCLAKPSFLQINGSASIEEIRSEPFRYAGNFRIDGVNFHFSVTYDQDLLLQDENLKTDLILFNELGVKVIINNPDVYDLIEEYVQMISNAAKHNSCVHSTVQRTNKLHIFVESNRLY